MINRPIYLLYVFCKC